MFRTSINIKESGVKIDYNSKITSIGSCFSENIGKKLADLYFDITINPTGVMFNPVSVFDSLDFIIRNKQFTEKDLFLNGDLWSSYHHSTLFSDTDRDVCLEKINCSLKQSSAQLKASRFLIITFGTAWIYNLADTGQTVANCHKQPAQLFERKRLTVNEITRNASETIQHLKQLNPDLNIIFAVSPVRHMKDGATENNISKGILLQAIQEITESEQNCTYFPSYEIVTDELRDYRFYADDMIHPSPLTVNYIFDKFKETYFDDTTKQASGEIQAFVQASSHRPLHINSAEYCKFENYLKQSRLKLLNKYPFLSDRI